MAWAGGGTTIEPVQSAESLDEFWSKPDPWHYEDTVDDEMRVARPLSASHDQTGGWVQHRAHRSRNSLLDGTILGRTPTEMKARTKQIAAWAGLEDYLDVPLRRYSSGMVDRLAFAIAADVQPDVLLVDEVLSVADESFQRRSGARMQELIAAGTAVVLLSHNLATVRDEAQRVVWLEKVGCACRVARPRWSTPT